MPDLHPVDQPERSEVIPELHSHKRYMDAVFTGLRREGSEITQSEFHGCRFVECSLLETTLHRCRLVDCLFSRCDLSLLKVPASVFSETRFEDSKVVGVNWAQANWTGTNLGKPLLFYRSAINHSTFIGLNLRQSEIVECQATGADFREADLSQADFGGTDLAECLFLDTVLTGADLSRARNYTLSPSENKLDGAKFSLPEALSLLYELDIELVEAGSEGSG